MFLEFNEFWIIDHSTTTAEAAGHTGGKARQRRRPLYRWGNPRRCLSRRAPVQGTRSSFGQHQHSTGFQRANPGEGQLAHFQPTAAAAFGGAHSSVDELDPAGRRGRKVRTLRQENRLLGRISQFWTYAAPKRSELPSPNSFSRRQIDFPMETRWICFSGPDGNDFWK